MRIERAKSIIEYMKGRRILVVGDFMLDRYVWGDCERISPEAPVPVISVRGESTRVGGAANVAMNIAAIGGIPLLTGIIGKDTTAEDLRSILLEKDITDQFLLESDDRPTTIKTRVIAQNQQVVRVDRENPEDIDNLLLERAKDIITYAAKDVDGILVSDYGKGMITAEMLEFLLSLAKQRDIFISVDPKERHFDLYHGISLMTPNSKETSFAVGFRVDTDDSVIEAGNLLLRRMDARSVIITRGADGMSVFERDRGPVHLATKAQRVFDVTGAGDTVIAIATLAGVSGASTVESAVLANHAAGISVGELGTRSVAPEELIESIREDGAV